MLSKIIITFFLSINLCFAASADKDNLLINFNIKNQVLPLFESTTLAINKTLSSNQHTCSTLELTPTLSPCPSFIIENLQDNFKGGIVGAVNKTISDGSNSSPDRSCSSSNNSSVNEMLGKMSKNKVPAHIIQNVLSKYNACFGLINTLGLKPNEVERAQKFIISSLVYLPQKQEAGVKNMLEAKSQLDIILGKESQEKCSEYNSPNLVSYCESLEGCKHTIVNNYLNQKAEDITKALKSIQTFNIEIKKNRMKGGDEVKLKEAEAAVENIKTLYPMITSHSLHNSFRNTFFPDNKIIEADVYKEVKNELIKTRKKVLANLKTLKAVNSCLEGKRELCSGLNQFLNSSAPSWRPENNIPNEGYYTCVESNKESRDEANRTIITGVVVNAALMFTPYVVLSGAKALYTGGKLIKSAAALAKITTKTIIGTAVADVTVSEIEVAKIYGACSSKLVEFSELQKAVPSCKSEENKVLLTTDIDACHQQIISGSLSAVASAVGVGFAKVAIAAAKATPKALLSVVAKNDEHEIEGIINDFAISFKNPVERHKAITDLNKTLSQISKSGEYTPDEIKVAIKYFVKKCKR